MRTPPVYNAAPSLRGGTYAPRIWFGTETFETVQTRREVAFSILRFRFSDLRPRCTTLPDTASRRKWTFNIATVRTTNRLIYEIVNTHASRTEPPTRLPRSALVLFATKTIHTHAYYAVTALAYASLLFNFPKLVLKKKNLIFYRCEFVSNAIHTRIATIIQSGR